LVLCSAAGLLLAGPAFADDLTTDDDLTTPLETINPAGGTPGNILIESTGSVVIVTPGTAAITINSDNTLTLNGSATNAALTDAIGVHVLGGFTGDLVDENGHPIGITGTGVISAGSNDTDDVNGTGNIALLLDGPGAFTGHFDLDEMSVAARGTGAIGVAIRSELIGDLNLGNVNAVGQDAMGLHTTASIQGTLRNTGAVTVSGGGSDNTKGPCAEGQDPATCDAVGGPAMWVGSDVTGGILNAGPADDATLTPVAANISSNGSAPALQIAPDGSSLTIGVLDDDTDPGFSFVNRGLVQGLGTEPGQDSTAIYIGRLEDDVTGNTATLTGGIYNRGTIRAGATSSNLNATGVPPADSDARAIVIAAGGMLPTIVNEGTITAVTADGPRGGSATAILIQSGGSLTSIVNTGTINATAGTTAVEGDPDVLLSAVAIRDESGTLTSLTNSGTIRAGFVSLPGAPIDGHSTHIAGDFSANTTTFDLANSGVIIGDVIFGSGASTFTIDGVDDEEGNNLATVTGNFYSVPGGTLDITVMNGTMSTAEVRAHNMDVGADGVIFLALPEDPGDPAVVRLSGDGNFAAGSRINFQYSKFVGDAATYTLVHADGTLTIDDLDGTAAAETPFLYNTTITNDGHDLVVDLDRKTAAELGFSGDLETIYNAGIAAVMADTLDGDDTALGAALMKLTDAESTLIAFESLLPTINGAQRNYAISMTDQFFGPVGARQRVLVTTPNQGKNLAFWGQEFWLSNKNDGGGSHVGYSDSGFGVAAGVDYGSLSSGRYGVAFQHFNGDSISGVPRVTKTLNNWTVFSGYANWADTDNGWFLSTQVSGGFGSFDEKRRVLVGDFTPTAKGHWQGWLAAWGATIGTVIGDDLFAIIPQAGVDALYMHEDAYKERGAGAANLAISERTNTSLRAFVGLVGRAQFELWGGYVRPEVHFGYSYEFAGQPGDANVYFISAQNMRFKISGPAEPVSRLIGGGSLHFVYNNWSAGADYDRTFGSTTSEAASVSVTGHF
jgi:hypothetical protein